MVFAREFDLKHRRKRKAHYVATVPPAGEPHHYKNNICVDLVTLPSHLLKALKESTDSYNSKVAERNRGRQIRGGQRRWRMKRKPN